jgi:hypothetical protein
MRINFTWGTTASRVAPCTETDMTVDLSLPEYDDCDPPDCSKFYNDPCEGCTYDTYAPCADEKEEP